MSGNGTHPVLIAGGGIGGLAAALGLAKVGAKVVVLERAQQFGEIGAGFELGPNALHALDYLGLGDAARAAGVYVNRLILMDAMSGEELYSVPVQSERFLERFGNPWVTTHRNDLHRVLLNAAQESDRIRLGTGSEVVGYEHTGDGVMAMLSNGEHVQGAALVAADGAWSNIRRQMIGDEVRLRGHTAYRALIPEDRFPSDMDWLRTSTTLWGGPKCHIITYPLSGTKLFNLVLVSTDPQHAPPGLVTGQPMSNDEVFSRFDHAHPRVKSIFTRASDYKMWTIGDRDPVANWIDGRVVLLGDAAHPMMQYLAQGACQALEDAVCLSHEFEACAGDINRVFANYQAKRIVRTARVQLMSRVAGEHVWHPGGPHAAVRNAILRKMPIEDLYGRMQWLWGGDGIDSPVA